MLAKATIVSLLSSATGQVVPGASDGGEWAQHLHKQHPQAGSCKYVKDVYKEFECCGNPDKETNLQFIPKGRHPGPNMCEGTKVPLPNTACTVNDVVAVFEQAGANVTKGFVGGMDVSYMTAGSEERSGVGRLGSATPITTTLFEAGLCPVNVHWHLGAEHLSVGQYDEKGTGPPAPHVVWEEDNSGTRRLDDIRRHEGERRLADKARLGFRCRHYDANNASFTKPYKWHHCTDMMVGETYEVHWPHSKLGACGTPVQYQTPFYDGVFCHSSKLKDTAKDIGVQGQIFTIINDEAYYYPDLFRGMIVDGNMGLDVAMYTGSTTGTSRDNQVCSQYTPITWQVDRKCHLISASSFDKMCADMKAQRDDMSGDFYPHGARVLVSKSLTANNMVDGNHQADR